MEFLQRYGAAVSILFALAGLLWQGGSNSQKLETVIATVAKIDARQESTAVAVAQLVADFRVLQEKYAALSERMGRLEAARIATGARP